MKESFSNPLDLWLVLDLFVRIMTMLVIVTILAKYIQGIELTFFVVLFILWAFRPFYLTLSDNLKGRDKNVNRNTNLLFYLILLFATTIGAALFINRYYLIFLPADNWRVLLDHLTAGFLVPIWFFIIYLGIGSFFHPNRKIVYSIKWFIIFSCAAILVIFLWDGIIQHFRDIDQIIYEIMGIALSWAYFLTFRKIKLKLAKMKENKPKKGGSKV